jgi:hypothetical protein
LTNKHNQVVIQRPPLGDVETVVRLRLGHAVTNLVGLVQMIGSARVEGLIDIYLDDLGMERLVTMYRLGVRFSPKTRLLTKSAKKLSKLMVQGAFDEMGSPHGEVRVTAAGGHEGRFIFLAGGGVVSIGCSLNNIDVNERAFVAGDKGDRAEFEARWLAATAIP